MTKWGTVTAAATITAAPPAAMPAWVSLRLRARFLIPSKVPGFGSNGFTRSLSQMSMSSRGSSMGFPQHRAQPGRQALNEGSHVHILRRIVHAVGGNSGAYSAQSAPLPANLAPVVPDQIRRDHV